MSASSHVDKAARNQKIVDFAPHVWSMYEQLLNQRLRFEDKLTYFVGIDTLLLVASITLFGAEIRLLNPIYLIPIALFALPIVIVLIHFFAPRLMTPWLERPVVTEALDNDYAYLAWFEVTYDCAEISFEYMKSRYRLLKVCLWFVELGMLFLIADVWFFFLPSVSDELFPIYLIVPLFALMGLFGYIFEVSRRKSEQSKIARIKKLSFEEWVRDSE